jgi:hypothetical protein
MPEVAESLEELVMEAWPRQRRGPIELRQGARLVGRARSGRRPEGAVWPDSSGQGRGRRHKVRRPGRASHGERREGVVRRPDPGRRELARPGGVVVGSFGRRKSGGTPGRGRQRREAEDGDTASGRGWGDREFSLIPCRESPHALIGGLSSL